MSQQPELLLNCNVIPVPVFHRVKQSLDIRSWPRFSPVVVTTMPSWQMCWKDIISISFLSSFFCITSFTCIFCEKKLCQCYIYHDECWHYGGFNYDLTLRRWILLSFQKKKTLFEICDSIGWLYVEVSPCHCCPLPILEKTIPQQKRSRN